MTRTLTLSETSPLPECYHAVLFEPIEHRAHYGSALGLRRPRQRPYIPIADSRSEMVIGLIREYFHCHYIPAVIPLRMGTMGQCVGDSCLFSAWGQILWLFFERILFKLLNA